MASTNLPQIDPNTDPYGYMRFAKNPDGSVSRLPPIVPELPPSPHSHPDDPIPVLSKDIPINQDTGTWARIYLPTAATNKLPLIVYFHGGGLVFCSPATAVFHQLCCDLALEIPAIIVSVKYRLAPEHRLPNAYEDGVEALRWVKTADDDWLTIYADLSNCYLMGSSAGGNIVYHVGLRAISTINDIKIRGLILHHPFFGGEERTPAEIRLVKDMVLPQVVTDITWDLALPTGASRDHEYCNPTVGIKSEGLATMRDRGWRVMVTGFEGDPMIDRQLGLARILKEEGIEVVEHFKDGGRHGLEHSDEGMARILYGYVKAFICTSKC